MNSKQLCQLVGDALDDMKAEDVTVLDVRPLTDMTDWMVVASARSDRHARSVAENVALEAKRRGQQPMGVEGLDEGQWVLVDLCDVVVHVMVPETRELYQLEKLWESQEDALARRRARS